MKKIKKLKEKQGFTLIELLIVIGIIAILAAIIFVALNPLKRFQDARDARRASAIVEILHAIKLDQVDNGGAYIAAVSGTTAGSVYMIVNGTMATGCNDNNANCDTNVSGLTNCVDLSGLVTEGYLGDIPVSPAGTVTWDSGAVNGEEGTGYTLQRDATGILTARACESENSTEISSSR